jgi:hypothetical protein
MYTGTSTMGCDEAERIPLLSNITIAMHSDLEGRDLF